MKCIPQCLLQVQNISSPTIHISPLEAFKYVEHLNMFLKDPVGQYT